MHSKAVDCGNLNHPTNGHVDTSSGTTYASVAEYSCDVGYSLNGPRYRMCEADGHWAHQPPVCRG